MTLSIVIVNYKTRGLLKQCLKGLRLVRPRIDHEIIIVDNASNDGTKEMIEEFFPEVHLIVNDRNRGFAVGNNQGILAATGRYVMILNPDIAVLEGSIEKLIVFLESHPDAAAVGPKLVNPDGSIQFSCYRFPAPMIPLYRRTPLGLLPWARRSLRHYLMMDINHDISRTADWLLGACLVVRRMAIDRIGLMDERFFLYFEDVDWCRRFWRAGFKVYYVPSALMVHYHQRLSAESQGFLSLFSSSTRIHIMSGIKYFWKYRGTL